MEFLNIIFYFFFHKFKKRFPSTTESFRCKFDVFGLVFLSLRPFFRRVQSYFREFNSLMLSVPSCMCLVEFLGLVSYKQEKLNLIEQQDNWTVSWKKPGFFVVRKIQKR